MLSSALPASLLFTAFTAQPLDQKVLDGSIQETLPSILELYRWFHQNPELSNQEEKTAAKLASELSVLGMEVTTAVGGHGVLGILRGSQGGEGPTILFRADMDALPVTEATGLPHASKNAGVMHACGHDIHMASAIGTLRVLAKHRDRWKGTVLFVGQPAEEVGTGARAMLADKKMTEVMKKAGKPKIALAFHDSSELATGVVEVSTGWATANVDSVDLVVYGKGGHGARPHEAIDPIVIGAEIVLSLQTIVSRRMAPGAPAVITVGQFTAGTKHNIIPSTATLLLTVRSYGDDARKFLLEEIKRTATQVARAHGAPKDPDMKVGDNFTAAGYNDPEWSARLSKRFQDLLGRDKVLPKTPTTTGEDFGEYARTFKIPGVMWWVGAQHAGKKKSEWYSVHSERYAPDPGPALQGGMRTSLSAILEALGP